MNHVDTLVLVAWLFFGFSAVGLLGVIAWALVGICEELRK